MIVAQSFYPVEYHSDSLKEHSKGKIHKSEPERAPWPEQRNENVNTAYCLPLFIRPEEILESVARSLFSMKEQAIANVCSVYLYLSLRLRIIFVKNTVL